MAKVIVANTYECPVCIERSYVENDTVTSKQKCLSCGYDNGASLMSKNFTSLIA